MGWLKSVFKNTSTNQGSEFPQQPDKSRWIDNYLAEPGNFILANVPLTYISDTFNLSGLPALIGDRFNAALSLLLNEKSTTREGIPMAEVDEAARLLYGLIHARYIITDSSMKQMRDKYVNKVFGECSREECDCTALLPVGVHEKPGYTCVKFFCPSCQEVYQPVLKCHLNIDGAFFGTTFPHLFLLLNMDLLPEKVSEKADPRVYGFKLFQRDQLEAVELRIAAAEQKRGETGRRVVSRLLSGAQATDSDVERELLRSQDSIESDGMESEEGVDLANNSLVMNLEEQTSEMEMKEEKLEMGSIEEVKEEEIPAMDLADASSSGDINEVDPPLEVQETIQEVEQIQIKNDDSEPEVFARAAEEATVTNEESEQAIDAPTEEAVSIIEAGEDNEKSANEEAGDNTTADQIDANEPILANEEAVVAV